MTTAGTRVHDYARFPQMLLNGGELDRVRILGRKTVELMTVNHLEDGMPDSVGSFSWIGVQGTSFWVDPEEDLIGVFIVQIRPNRDIVFRQEFRRRVYQALIE